MVDSGFDESQFYRLLDGRSHMPILDGGKGYHADARLTCYAGAGRWFVLIEHVDFFPPAPGHDGVMRQYYAYGSETGFKRWHATRLTEDAGDPVFLPPDNFELNPKVTSVRVAGVTVEIDISEGALREKGIPVPEESWMNRLLPNGAIEKVRVLPALGGEHLLWTLAATNRELLFASEEEKSAMTDLPKLIQLEEWNHPLILTRKEKPSENETFQMLARVLATGDPSAYQPTKPPNTHWSQWVHSERV